MSKGGTTSAGSATEIPQWVQDAGRKQYQTGTELGQIGYTPYYGADVAAFNPMQESAFRSTGTAADAFGMGPASTVPAGATFGPHSPTWATDGIPAAETFAGGMRGYSGMPMYTEALNTLQEQRPYQKQQLEQQFIDPSTGLTPEGRKIQDINSLYNEAFNRNVSLEGVSTYLPLMQQGMTNNELRKILYDSEEAKRLGKTSQGAPIEIGVGGGLLGSLLGGAGSYDGQNVSQIADETSTVDGLLGLGNTAGTGGLDTLTVDPAAAANAAASANAAANAAAAVIDTTGIIDTIGTIDTTATELTDEEKLESFYTTYLGREIGDAGRDYYGKGLADGSLKIGDIEADLAWVQSQGGEAALAAQRAAAAAAQNSANLGFGASSVTGNAADDAAQVAATNQLLADNSAARFDNGTQYVNNDQGDLTNIFTGASDYLQGFATEMTKVLDNSLVGKIANTLEGQQTSAALVDATGAPKEDINLALEILSTGSELAKAAFKMTPLGQLVVAIVPSLGQSTLNTNVPVTDLTNSGSDNKTDNNTNSNVGLKAGQTDYGLY